MAKDYKLEADIASKWIGIPVYRLWIDGELICERSFWPNPDKHIIRETVIVALEDGQHEMILEQVDASLGSTWADKLLVTDLSDHTSRLFTYGNNDSLKQHLHFAVGDQGITRWQA
jgi:hypothetical protein